MFPLADTDPVEPEVVPVVEPVVVPEVEPEVGVWPLPWFAGGLATAFTQLPPEPRTWPVGHGPWFWLPGAGPATPEFVVEFDVDVLLLGFCGPVTLIMV